MILLGISCHYHEAAAALIIDGKIVAAVTQERLSRKKHDPAYPQKAIRTCLRIAGISARDIEYVVFYEKPFVKFPRHLIASARYFPKSLPYFVESMMRALGEKLWIRATIAKDLHIDEKKILFVPQ